VSGARRPDTLGIEAVRDRARGEAVHRIEPEDILNDLSLDRINHTPRPHDAGVLVGDRFAPGAQGTTAHGPAAQDGAGHTPRLMHPDLPTDLPPIKSLDILPNNLPRQLNSFIGREKEMAEVKRLLSTAYLVTLTGSGGAGKTRLASLRSGAAIEIEVIALG
jgi:hypothetical protein